MPQAIVRVSAACCCIFTFDNFAVSKSCDSVHLSKQLPFIGLILIGHSIIFFNDKMYHPSFYTLSNIIGVCLIIWFSNKKEIFTKILSTKLFVGIQFVPLASSY